MAMTPAQEQLLKTYNTGYKEPSSMFKDTINAAKTAANDTVGAFKSVGGEAYNASKNVLSSAGVTPDRAGKVLAHLKTGAMRGPFALDGAYGAKQIYDDITSDKPVMNSIGISGDAVMNTLSGAGAIPGLGVPALGGRLFAEGVASLLGAAGEGYYKNDGLTPAAREFAKTLQKDAKGNYIAPTQTDDTEPPAPATTVGQVDTGTPSATMTPFMQEITSGNLTGTPSELAIKAKAARGELTPEAAQAAMAELVKNGDPFYKQFGMDAQGKPLAQAATQAQASDPMTAIRASLSNVEAARSKIKNPLDQEVKVDPSGVVSMTGTDGKSRGVMQLREAGDNPLMALAQLQQAIGLAVPQAVRNKMARNEMGDHMKMADAESGLVKLADTLATSAQARDNDNIRLEDALKTSALGRDKAGVEMEDAKLKVEQTKRLQDSMSKLSALDGATDPDGTKRTALQQTILTMLGKEPKDGYELKEFGGGNDPTTGLPLPKRLAMFNAKTGKVEFVDGGESKQPQKQQYTAGQVYRTAGGKVVKFVGYDKDGQPQFDDQV